MNTTYDFGMIGLGTMGRNLLLNIADHGYNVTGHDRDADKVALLEKEGSSTGIKGFSELTSFVNSLNKPRAIMMLVPAGKIVDNVIEDLLPLLDEGDLIIDGGNSYFADTDRRFTMLRDKGIHFFGIGISGGEEGARKGPSMMPGGDKNAYEVVRTIFESVAAHVDDEPCVTYLGPGACGHFVKMVHNGIEYGIMQLISEIYGIMRSHMGLNNQEIHEAFKSWDEGRLKSFLVEITADIFLKEDDLTDNMLVDMISDQARSKGTGKWTSQLAMDLQVPVPTIDMAVAMRDMSKYKTLRKALEKEYRNPVASDDIISIQDLENALYFSYIISYAQGLHMLSQASEEYGYDLNLASIAKIWRGGCIIRAELLHDIYNAFSSDPNMQHLLLDEKIRLQLLSAEKGFRKVLVATTSAGIATPALSASLTYYDMLRKGNMPSNLIQAQRDYFGAHTYERTDREGKFHTDW
ncbi:NADP-dependent phosphogluconate dehydrogenase [Fulvivirga sedimenti]|uniref:6-phosphogluconate dehydrogenase, decarboxylating n=1 Tax=Fulvivirga sedimenti TaxID=2879465 RepID=A0A9X1HMY7_9BACT|nr:NADP-dependent phosphogluconate dehydrogenase [Fulvivirga sedimenti]MCA6073542.1 NADP-dependent phosphogluconate dehydrogenase [Fulvivirga sedimenti]